MVTALDEGGSLLRILGARGLVAVVCLGVLALVLRGRRPARAVPAPSTPERVGSKQKWTSPPQQTRVRADAGRSRRRGGKREGMMRRGLLVMVVIAGCVLALSGS